MDAGNLIYIIAIIIYFIYTATRKNKNPEGMEGQGSGESDSQEAKPVSFEDLLKEIRKGQQQTPEEVEQPRQFVDEQRPSRRESRRFEPVRSPRKESTKQNQAYSKFEGEVEDTSAFKHKKLDDQVSLSASISGIKSDIAVEEVAVRKKNNRYKSLLQNPKTVKDAVILSEILGRKSF